MIYNPTLVSSYSSVHRQEDPDTKLCLHRLLFFNVGSKVAAAGNEEGKRKDLNTVCINQQLWVQLGFHPTGYLRETV